jgi:diguanylate cyclase (GGDEF)-like protein/PAS domain S-box-containing protein
MTKSTRSTAEQHPEKGAPRVSAEATLNSIGDAVLSTDVDGNVTFLNLAAEAATGWSREVALGQPLDEVFHIINRDTREAAPNPVRLAIQLNNTVGLTPNCVLVRRDGQEVEIEDSVAPIRDRDGRVTGAVIVFRDAAIAHQLWRQMSYLAQHDSLTGLPNRVLLNDRLTEAVALAHRRHKPLAVLFLDVDGFKAVNDSFGHAAGDTILQAIAAQLRACLRQPDTVSRYGGDEFVIVLSEIEQAKDALLVAKKLVKAVSVPHRVDRRDVTISASVGIALYPEHGDDAETLIGCADTAMYHVKHGGEGNCQLFDPHMNAPARAGQLSRSRR